MNKVEKQELEIAMERKNEIARKVQAQKLQASGYVRSQLAGLTCVDRLIDSDHLMRKGMDLARSNAQYEVDRAKKELKAAKPREHKLVKRLDGKTIGVDKVYTDR